MNKELKRTIKYLKKNKVLVKQTIIPVVVFCVLVTVIGILLPRPNDNISPSNRNYLFENRNPAFNVAFGKEDNPEEQYVRFEARTADNPFEKTEKGFWDTVKQAFSKKQGIEFALSEINFGETDSELSKQLKENLGNAIDQMEKDSISTDTEVIEVGRLLGEKTDTQSKKTVINKNVYPGIDVEYQILEDLGVKEEIVIRDIEEYTSNCGEDNECLLPLNEFVFDLKLDEGLELKQSMAMTRGKIENTYYITDSNGNYFAHFLPTFAVDEAGSRTSGVDFDISNVEGNSYRMIVTLDPDWLFSNKRIFPIRIDPSIVHDTTTEFDTGSFYNTEVVTGPKIQLEDPEVYYTDSNVVGYWKMDDNIESIVPDDSNLEAYWDLIESSGSGAYLLDKSDNTNHGTPTGTTYVDGKINGGRNFNGDDTITIPNHSSIAFERTDSFTLEAWFKTTNADLVNIVAKMDDSAPYRGYDLNVYQSKIWFQIVGTWDSSTLSIYTNSTFADGNWHHVVATYNGSSSATGAKIYVDGAAQATTTYRNTLSSTIVATTPFTIGDRYGASGAEFNGDLDEIGVYSKELNSTEVLARYRAGLEIKDSSGNDNHGLNNGPDYITEGFRNGARSFNGTTDYISVADSSELGITGNLTVETWIYPNASLGTANSNRWLEKGDNYFLMEGDGSTVGTGVTFLVKSSNVNYYVDSGVTHEANQWYHVVGVHDDTANLLRLYINGEQVNTKAFSGPIDDDNLPLRIGSDDSGKYFDGIIDEVRISNVARSADDIQRLYQISYEKMIQGAHTSAELDIGSTADIESITWTPVGDDTGDGETPYSTTGLVGQWDFNESSGTVADNEGSCGSSCDGTLTNFSNTTGQDVVVGSGWTSDNRRWGEGALMFDGTDDYNSCSDANCGGTDKLDMGTSDWTLETWVKTNKSSTTQSIINKDPDGTTAGYVLRINSEGKVITNMVLSGSSTATSSTVLNVGEFYHLVAVYDRSNNLSLYINGVLEDSIDISSKSGSNDSSARLTFGADANNANPLRGVMDTTRIYSRALTSSEILSNYQSGNIEMKYRTSADGSTWSSWKGGTESSVESFDDEEYLYDPDNSGLLAYYPMDETSGSTATDVAGTNNGTVTGTSIIEGRHKKGRDFTSSSDVMAISSIDLSDISYTIETWFKFPLDSNGGNWNTLTRGVNNDHQVLVQTSTKEIGVYDNAIGGGWYSSGYDLDNLDSGWHHLAAVGAGSNTDFYIDGQYVGDSAYKSHAEISYIGNYQGGGQNWGVMDEFKIYNEALTSTEIYNNWFEGSSNYANIEKDSVSNSIDSNGAMEIRANGPSVDENTVGYWRMDDNIESIIPVDSNLEGYWDLVESSGSGAYLLDKSDNSNNGTPTGATYSDGHINGGRDFSGSSQYINIPNNSSLSFERTDAFSVEAWFKTDGTISLTQSLVGKMSNSAPYRGYDLDISNNNIHFLLINTWDTNVIQVYASATNVADTNWHHVIATYDGSSNASGAEIYIDGALQSKSVSKNSLSATIIQTTPVRIGSRDGGAYFDGEIDEVAIYSKELNSTEVLARYNAGLDIKDSSGNGYHGSSNYLPYVKGKYDGARSFDGTSDQVEIKTNMGLSTTNVTLESWVNLDSTSESGLIVNVGGASNGYGMGIGGSTWDDDGNDLILLFDMVRWIDTGYSVGTGWNHIVMTLDSSAKPRAYVNGNLVYSDTSTNPTSPSSVTNIGGYGERYLDATIDEVRVSNVARTTEEILESYNMGKNEYIQKTITSNNISNNTILPLWIASNQLGVNMEMIYAEDGYEGGVTDVNTLGYWKFDAYRYRDSSGYKNNGRDSYNGIEYGIRDWNVSIIMNQWWGSSNAGEMDLECPGGDAECYLITMDGEYISTPTINGGIAMVDSGSGGAYIMYSPSLASQGITSNVTPSDHYVGVRWTGSVWQYDNNSTWVTFTPNDTNILVATVTLFSSASALTIHPLPVDGYIGSGRKFDGSKDYISTESNVNIANKSFTIETWAKRETSGDYDFILTQGTDSDYQGLHLGFRDSDTFTCAFWNSDLTTTTTYTDSDWHHWACTYDVSSNVRKLYRDGTLIASDISSADYQGTGPLVIGGRLYSTNYYFDGSVDEVRVSDVVRSPDKIRQSYEVGRRTHPVKVTFKADLESSNTISSVSDTSFTISEQDYGVSDYIENIDIGDKIIIKETYQGVEYIAQGDLATVNTSTGAVTVSSWDASSSFPSQGFTTAATVFKWQREYVDIRYPLDEDINAITKLTFRKTTDTPAVFYIDDLKKATYSSDYDASEFGALGATTAVETAIDSFDQDYLYDTSASNLTAYYPMDEGSGTAVDNIISTSYDGTASGTNVIDGKFNKGRRFDGTDDYVNIGNSLQPSLPVSISAWIYLENIGNTMGIFNNDKLISSAHNHSGIFINITSAGILSVNYGDNTACSTTSRQSAETQEALQIGKWIHMVGILRGSSDIDIYLDGIKQPVNYTGTGGSLTYGSRNGAIGAVSNCSDGSTQPLDGSIDELEVYTKSLSSSEVWNLYKTGSTSPRSIRTTNIGSHVEGTGAWQFDSDTYTVDPATVGLWHLDESSGSGAYLLDSSYNSYHGTPSGTTFVSGGKFNGARSFDGTDDYITTSLDTEADSLYADTGYTWTVEAWFKHNGGLTEDGVIVGRGAGTGTSGHFGIFVDTSGNLRTVLRGAYTTITSSVADNTWHHVAVTWDGSRGRGYFDGEFQTELTNGTATSQAYNVSIGAQANGTNYFYEGQIDEVRIANVSLSASEISSSYNMGKDNYITKTFTESDLSDHATLPFWIASDNLDNNFDVIYGEDSYGLYEPDVYTEGLWHLDESSGTLYDSSTNSNNATASGTTYVNGRHNGGRLFNGTSDYIDAGTSSTLAPNTELTVSAWVYANSGPASEGRTAVSKLNWVSSTESYGWNLGAMWTEWSFDFIVSDGGSTNDHIVKDPTFFNKYMGEWVHVTGVFKSGEYIRLYENGDLVAEEISSVPTALSYSSNSLVIGRRSSQTQSEWDGMIDEVRVSSKALSTAEVQAEYNRGSYTHDITVDFKADLQSGNLISNSADTSFTISEQAYGATNPIENLEEGDKIIVKEVVSGTEYIAQGDVDTLTAGTGAVTVDAWDTGSTFPGSGFTTTATVFKWQMEEINISDFLTNGETELEDIVFKKVSDVEGILWVDDLSKSTAAYNPDTTYLEGVQYVQYKVIFSKWDDNPYLDLYLSEVSVDYSSGPTMDQLMRHGKWFNSSGEKQPFWWVGEN